MSFVTIAFVIGLSCLLFGLFACWCAYRSSKLARGLLLVYAVAFLVLSLFSVLVGGGLAIELTNQAPCQELLVNESSYYVYGDNYSGYHWDYEEPNPSATDINLFHTETSYIYEDSCADRTTPSSIEMLFVAYTYVLYMVLLVSVLALMFLGLKRLLFKW